MMIHSGSSQALRIMWEKTYATNYTSVGNSVRQTPDGGYIVSGTQWHRGGLQSDILLVKTDDAGNVAWTRRFAVGEVDRGLSVELTTDGGYIIAGSTWGWGKGKSDVCFVRSDADGHEVWSKTFGGKDREQSYSVKQTSDGGYIIAGETASFGTGNYDIYLIKTDIDGELLWSKTFGGYNRDCAYSVQQTIAGGYIIAGETDSFGSGNYDVYLIKTDAKGNEIWSSIYGSKYKDYGRSVVQTIDGGFLVAGSTWRSGSGYSDIFLLKTDGNGKELWTKSFGGKYNDNGYAVQLTTDGGYIIAGNTRRFRKTANCDVYLVKTDGNGNLVWEQTFGGEGFDSGYSVQQTRAGGYIVSGETNSFGLKSSSVYLVKTDANGNQ